MRRTSCFTGFLAHLNSYEIFTELVNSSSDLNRFVTGKWVPFHYS
jgi:hypothetical protein